MGWISVFATQEARMQRSIFGAWGADLDDAEFAKAVAALGLRSAHRPWSPWRRNTGRIAEKIATQFTAPEEPVEFQFGTGPAETLRYLRSAPSARVLANAWNRAQSQIPWAPRYRLSFDTDINRILAPAHPEWIIGQFRNPALNARSIYIGEQPRTSEVDWRWPIRVGLLNSDAERDYDSHHSSTIANLTVPVRIREQKGVVDLLWIPRDISSALAELEHSDYPVYAHAVAITGGVGGLDWFAVERAKNRIRELTQAQAVAVASSGQGWLRSFVTHLSHDASFDVAAYRSAGSEPYQPPGSLLWSSDKLIESSSVKKFARDMIQAGLYGSARPLDIEGYINSQLGLPQGPTSAPRLLDALEKNLDGLDWQHESGGATTVAAISSAIERAKERRIHFASPFDSLETSSEILPPNGPRFLQTAVFAEPSDGSPQKVKEAFIAGLQHSVRVHIGPDLKDDEHLVLSQPLPEEKLPPGPNGHLLVVTFFEPQIMKEPQVQTLLLPQIGGSIPCTFRFTVEPHMEAIEGRVTVLHENRVLQTGLIRGRVAPAASKRRATASISPEISSSEDTNAGITFVLAGAVRRAVADLDQRTRFNAALVLNHIGENPGVQAIAGNNAAYLTLSDPAVIGAKEAIEKALDSGDWDYKEYEGLFATGTTELLRLLAIKGSDLYVYVTRRFPAPVKTAQRLQVIMAKEGSRFPFDFLYEFKAPNEEAPVCPHAKEALRTGACSKDCKAREEAPASVICPLGFWGLSRVLEWHTFSPEASSALPQYAAGKVDIDIAPTSQEVRLGGACLFGYSNQIEKAEEGSISGFQERASQYSNAPTVVDSWTDWKAGIRNLNPSLLILLVHTRAYKYGTQLEMGPPNPIRIPEDSLLATSDITRDYVTGPGVTGTPIILLLGCTTARSNMPFETVASAFEYRADAGIIVATSNLIYGPKAVHVAETFMKKLREIQPGDSFGDVMLRVRRSALADGTTMILCISAYGDADWKLVQ
jgi:hypothetical protein